MALSNLVPRHLNGLLDGWYHISANMPFRSTPIPSGPHSCGLLSTVHVAGMLRAGWGAQRGGIQGSAGVSSGPAGLRTSSLVPDLLIEAGFVQSHLEPQGAWAPKLPLCRARFSLAGLNSSAYKTYKIRTKCTKLAELSQRLTYSRYGMAVYATFSKLPHLARSKLPL